MSNVTQEEPIVRVLLAGVALFVGAVLGAGGLIVGFVLTIVVGGLLRTTVEISPTLAIVISLIFIQGVGCAGVAVSYYKLREPLVGRVREALDISQMTRPFEIPVSIPDFEDVVAITLGYVVAIVGIILASMGITAIQEYTGTEIQTGTNSAAEVGMQNPEVLLLLIPASILIIGPGEELLFRGVVQGRMREAFSPVPGIAIPTVLFAGLHWFAISGGSPEGNLVALAVLLVPSAVFGVAYEYTGNIVVPSLIHGLYNATLFSLLYVVVAFGDQLPEQALFAIGL